MKLTLTRPNENGLFRTKPLLVAYLSYHNIFVFDDCQHFQLSWNDCYSHYDLYVYDVKDRNPCDGSVNIEKVVEFLGKEFKCEVADYFYDYESDKRHTCGVRIWIWP